MNHHKRIINFLSLYIIPKTFKKSDSLIIIADNIFKRMETIDDDEYKIKQFILSITPLPPFIKHNSIDVEKITDEMVTELLNSYIADGGTRIFKDILDPDSEEQITDSDEEMNTDGVYYIEGRSDSE